MNDNISKGMDEVFCSSCGSIIKRPPKFVLNVESVKKEAHLTIG
ncbi:hypothetical protein LEP1GSC150_1823 [Leptospira interrogans serovar Copenhageni str. LT2050]|uniref:Uncharacterized protein n=1 Tax=Leptospira interrogans serovar Copenhageni str. LT2050 TaxID=1001598 RepID=M3GE35_LEPIT|nr:hypothetical protein LEP1GSC150_1823 [Leptospira interrogans serovar Copenhageni str. LT2050]